MWPSSALGRLPHLGLRHVAQARACATVAGGIAVAPSLGVDTTWILKGVRWISLSIPTKYRQTSSKPGWSGLFRSSVLASVHPVRPATVYAAVVALPQLQWSTTRLATRRLQEYRPRALLHPVAVGLTAAPIAPKALHTILGALLAQCFTYMSSRPSCALQLLDSAAEPRHCPPSAGTSTTRRRS